VKTPPENKLVEQCHEWLRKTKVCAKCEKEKSVADFSDGRKSICIECERGEQPTEPKKPAWIEDAQVYPKRREGSRPPLLRIPRQRGLPKGWV